MYYTFGFGLIALVGSYVFCKVRDIEIEDKSGTWRFFPSAGQLIITLSTLAGLAGGFAYGSKALIDGTHPVQVLIESVKNN